MSREDKNVLIMILNEGCIKEFVSQDKESNQIIKRNKCNAEKNKIILVFKFLKIYLYLKDIGTEKEEGRALQFHYSNSRNSQD